MSFHTATRNHLLLVFPREVYVVDLEIGQAIGFVAGGVSNPNNGGYERSNSSSLSPIVEVYSCSQRDAVYLLHENGTVSLRARRGIFPKISRTGSSNLPRSISLSSSLMVSHEESKANSQNSDSLNALGVHDDDFLEISYDLKGITCDTAVRLAGGAKGAKVNKILNHMP